jgi:hypothetical protein
LCDAQRSRRAIETQMTRRFFEETQRNQRWKMSHSDS